MVTLKDLQFDGLAASAKAVAGKGATIAVALLASAIRAIQYGHAMGLR
jgi:hypothetical protein